MDTFIGSICIFGFNYAPRNWAFCQGQILPISSNAALFSLLGTAYGGNGTSNFGLPNLQNDLAVGQGTLTGGSNYVMGEAGGATSVSLNSGNLPAHIHGLNYSLKANATATDAPNPVGTYNANSNGKPYASAGTSGTKMAAFSMTLGNAGGNTPVGLSDPSLVMNYCIALYGIFPTRQ